MFEIANTVSDLGEFWQQVDPWFKFGSAHIMKNKETALHSDTFNCGCALTASFGNFQDDQGRVGYTDPITQERRMVCTRNTLVFVNVRAPHFTESWSGCNRYSVVLFTRQDTLKVKENDPVRVLADMCCFEPWTQAQYFKYVQRLSAFKSCQGCQWSGLCLSMRAACTCTGILL